MTTQSTAPHPFRDLPDGTVTFLFSDIEGSTQLLYRLGRRFTAVVGEHHRILREAIDQGGGHVVRTEGDSFFVAFPRATDAVAAAVAAQRGLAAFAWPEGAAIRVRMGLHTGEAAVALDDYVGIAVHCAARIAHAGSGGQVLLSETTAALAGDELPEGVSLLDLGRHLLKDLHRPERILQLRIAGLPSEFAPLKTQGVLPPAGARLPRPVGACPYRGLAAFREADAPFYHGREAFVSLLEETLRRQVLTAVIVGPSGSGKSSALFAGLLPRLRREAGWQVALLRPGAQPFYALAAALLPLLEPGLSKTDLLAETAKLAERLGKGEVRLAQVVERILADASIPQREHPVPKTALPVTLSGSEADSTPRRDTSEESRPREGDASLESRRGAFHGADPLSMTSTPNPALPVTLSGSEADSTPRRVTSEESWPREGDASLGSRRSASHGTNPLSMTSTRQILLVVDQFEELYTLCPDAKAQQAFIDELLATAAAGKGRRPAPCVILLTLRADFMGQALAHRPFADALQEGAVLMGPMTRAELRAAIERPAGLQGAAFEAGLVERILDDVGEKPGNLPLLEFTLTLLWERQTDGWLTHTHYEAMGSVEGALAAYADQVYAELGPAEQERARHALVQLVRPGEGTEDTRRVTTREELGEENWRLIQHLADRRLVVTGRNAAGRETAEVVHEALIGRWGRFREWMDADQAFRAWQERLRASLRGWQESEQDEGALLAGAPLAAAESWLAERPADLSTAEAGYIQASVALQARRQQERQRRRQVTVLGLSAGLLIALVLAGLALLQRQDALTERQNAQRQASIGLAAQAELELNGAAPERAVLLALEALEKYPYTWQAEQTLGQVVREFRLRRILTGHTYTARDVAWSPGGSQIATAGDDGTLRIWDAQTYTEVFKTAAHPSPADMISFSGVRELAWSPDGTRIATAGQEGTAKVWDAASGQEIVTFSGHTDGVWGVAWSPDGVWVASASKDGTAKVWDAATGQERLALAGHAAWVKSLAWSPDGKRIATAGDDGAARIWDATAGAERLRLSGHTNWVWSVAWSPDGTRLATASEDGTVRVWEAASGRELADIRFASPVWQAAWSPDSKQVATTSATGTAQVWDVASGKETFALQGRTPEQFDVAWSPDGKSLATTAGPDFSVRIWDASPTALTLLETGDVVFWVSWSPAGRRIAATEVYSGIVGIFDAMTGAARLSIATGHSGLQDARWSPDGSRIVTTGLDNLAKVWDANTGQELLTFRGHVGEPPGKFVGGELLIGAGWSPDGSRIATTGGSGRERIWDARTGQEYVSFQATRDIAPATRWSPDGKRLASVSLPEVLQIWDAATGAPILGGYVHNTAQLSYGDPITGFWGLDWSPEGDRILTTSLSGEAAIWAAGTGQKMLAFREHSAPVSLPMWSPNGRRVATGDVSGVIKVWDAATGAVLLDFSVPVGDELFNVAWSPDGTRLAAATLLPSVEIHRVWQSKEELVAYTRECCVVRQLTPAERKQFGLP